MAHTLPTSPTGFDYFAETWPAAKKKETGRLRKEVVGPSGVELSGIAWCQVIVTRLRGPSQPVDWN